LTHGVKGPRPVELRARPPARLTGRQALSPAASMPAVERRVGADRRTAGRRSSASSNRPTGADFAARSFAPP